MKKSWAIIILSLLLYACKGDNKDDRIKPQLRHITESVYASANVVPRESYSCRPSKSGIIKKIFVNEGDMVKKGQVLFEISVTADVNNRLRTAEINLQEAEANYSGANNLLLNIELEIQNLKEQNLIDSANYFRKKRLWEQSIGSKNDLERFLLTYQSSSSKLSTLNNKYAQTKTNLKNNYKKAQNLASAERSQLKDFEVRSEIDGKVFFINKKVGEFISPQESFSELGSTSDYIIEMDIDEVDISKIEIGDTAIVALEAYPNEVFTSPIYYISDKKDERTQTFEVKGDFSNSNFKLYDGLSGEANIVIARRKDVLTIPTDYLVNGNKVYTPEEELNVKVGLRSLEEVEILQGIDSTTTLVKPN